MVSGRARELGGSEYLELIHDKVAGRPHIDLELEKRVQLLCRRAVREGLVESAHDCSDGGLAVAPGRKLYLGRCGISRRL